MPLDLPGVTGDYRKLAGSILDNVLPAFKGIDGSLDMKGAEDSVVSLSTSFGLLGASSNVASNDISKGLSKALSGKSISELGDLIFFEEQPALLAEIQNQLTTRNVESLKDLDAQSRLDLLQGVGVKFSSPEYIGKINQTASSLLEGFSTTLFDQSEGVFGLMRDLDTKTKGSQSVYQQMGFLLDLTIGKKGVLGTDGPVANLLEALGLDLPDPMRVLQRGLQKTVGFLEGAVEIGNDIAERVKKGASASRALGRYLGVLDTGAVSAAKIGPAVGLLYSKIYTRILGLLDRVPWAKIGNAGGEFLGAGIINLFRNFPWGKALAVIGKAAIVTADFMLSTFVGILRGVAIELGDWVRDGVLGAAKSVGSAIWNAPGNLVQGGRAVSGPYRAAAPTGRGRTARRGADGFTPAGEPDILSALARAEMQAVPGAGLIVANDTEHVVPKSAARQAMSGGAGGSARRSTTVHITQHLNLPQGSTRQMAESVLQHLNALVSDSLESQLA